MSVYGKIEIINLKEVLAAIKRMDDTLATSPQGAAVESGLRFMSVQTERHASVVTHQDTRTLYRSYQIYQDSGPAGAFASIYIDPTAVNPHGYEPSIYGPIEFARGGSHDAFGQAFDFANVQVADDGIRLIFEKLREVGSI